MTVINNCPICNQVLEEVTDKDGFLIKRRCNKCGINWSIFDLEVQEEKKDNLDKWIKNG